MKRRTTGVSRTAADVQEFINILLTYLKESWYYF